MNNLKTSKRNRSKRQTKETAYGYTRTATEVAPKEFSSIENQTKRINEYCQKNNIKLLKVFSDSAKSGIKLNRLALNRLLKRIKKTPVNYLVITGSDRLTRDIHQYLTLKSLLKKAGIEIVTVNSPQYEIDPYSKFFDEILAAAVNSLYSKVMAARR